jgi:predicted O-linked N-acetylglucosamine transferase (SPINDLY family)
MEIDPTCVSAHDNLLAALHYLPVHDPQSIVIESRNWNRLHAEPLARLTQPHTNSRDPERPLRIGYVSPDFRVHAVSQFMLPLLESHDRGLFHIFGYADVATPDDLTARLQAQVHTWRNIVGMTNEKVAALIRQDEIDILVDLAGHTADNRLLVLAMKPAPIQVTYLGYPGTTGVAAIDYRFTDALADPPGMTDAYFSERLIRLPQSAWCLREPPNAPPISELPAIKAGFVTFGSFNNFAKVNVPLLKIWARILLGMANSRLRLKAQGLGSNLAQQVVLQTMADCGIEPGRVDVSGWVPQPRHLAQYGQIDIALDAYPYHGTTTTCEAIWMGVPVVTLAGMNHLSRVGVSLLTNLGLPQLIAQSPEQYIQIAIAMAGDLPRLAALRATLRQRLKDSPLMNGPRQARDIESAYRAMWRHWCQTSRPK